MGEFLSSSSQYAKALDYYGALSSNVAYDREVIKLCGLTTLYMSGMCVAEIIKSTITDLDLENDLLILAYSQNTYGKKCLLRFKNLSSIKASSEYILNTSPSVLRQAYRATNASSWNYDDKIMYYASRYTPTIIYITGITLQFGRPTEIERYDIDTTGTTATIDFISSEVTQNYTIPYYDEDNTVRLRLNCTNLGSVVQHEVIDTYAGIELESGANYPTTVVDEQSFRTYYNNRIYNDVGNPDILEGEVVSGVRDVTTFVNCSVSETPPATQADSEYWDIDDATPEDQEKIADDVDSSANDEDENEEEDPNSEGEKDPGENEGNNTIPTIDNVFKYNMSQFETQWLLSEAEFQALGLLINSGDFLQSISTVIASVLGIDPLSGIVSVQVAPVSLIPNVDLTLKDMVIRGIEMTGNVKFKDTGLKSVTVQGYTLEENVKEFDLGEKLIDEQFGSYMDLVDTQMTLYLPFVGNIDLDIRDFYLGNLWIKGFVESFTGQIVYYIISKDKPDTKGNLQTKIVSTLTGNCYSTIPITQDSYGSFMNSFTRG